MLCLVYKHRHTPNCLTMGDLYRRSQLPQFAAIPSRVNGCIVCTHKYTLPSKPQAHRVIYTTGQSHTQQGVNGSLNKAATHSRGVCATTCSVWFYMCVGLYYIVHTGENLTAHTAEHMFARSTFENAGQLITAPHCGQNPLFFKRNKLPWFQCLATC